MVKVLVLNTNNRVIEDFAKERNYLLDKSEGDWFLFLDTDEKISKELKEEILDAARMTKHDGYFIARRDYFLGKWLRFGETGNIKLLRLGRKGAGKWVRKVHEYWDIKNAGELKGTILHYPSLTIQKINFYSEIDAKEFGKFQYWQLAKPPLKFFLNYFIKLGFLDGQAGFFHAFLMSFQSLVVRVKQYEKTIIAGDSR